MDQGADCTVKRKMKNQGYIERESQEEIKDAEGIKGLQATRNKK